MDDQYELLADANAELRGNLRMTGGTLTVAGADLGAFAGRCMWTTYKAGLTVGQVLVKEKIGPGMKVRFCVKDGQLCAPASAVGGADTLPDATHPIEVQVQRNGTVIGTLRIDSAGAVSVVGSDLSTYFLPGDLLSLVVSATDADAAGIYFTLTLFAEAA